MYSHVNTSITFTAYCLWMKIMTVQSRYTVVTQSRSYQLKCGETDPHINNATSISISITTRAAPARVRLSLNRWWLADRPGLRDDTQSLTYARHDNRAHARILSDALEALSKFYPELGIHGVPFLWPVDLDMQHARRWRRHKQRLEVSVHLVSSILP